MMPIDPAPRRGLKGPVPGWILLGTVTAACWIFYLAGGGTGMKTLSMSTLEMPHTIELSPVAGPWSARYALMMVGMWWSMMIAMMLPGSIRHFWAQARSGELVSTRMIGHAAGYSLIWLAFSLVATAVQYQTETLGLLHGMKMWSTDRTFSAGLLAVAGVYQFTAFKRDALRQCGSAVDGANPIQAGMVYGSNCLQASFALMFLLLVGGAMNLYWVITLAAIVAAEKRTFRTLSVSHAVGGALLTMAAFTAMA